MTDRISVCLTIVPALPLLAAVVVAVLGPKVLRAYSHLPVIFALAGSCICSLILCVQVNRQQTDVAAGPAADGFEQRARAGHRALADPATGVLG
jgi:NADH:ubiquinone oxidoreductase subunit 5 (subunit L)/multisubunit Na+/H+ antiporter MnhA subunit